MSDLYAGSILLIDLSTKQVSKEPTSSFSRQFLGGRGINGKLLYDRVPPEVDALDPQSLLLFGTGPLSGTACPGSSRIDVMAKSPMTGLIGFASIGGHAAAELKFAGYDHIAITGKADQPVYISVNNDEVQIKDASSIWGKDTYTAQTLLRQELGDPELKVLCIGPAGENVVRYATVQSGLGHGAGRTGTGAVMGSKKLKAIAIRGTKGLKLANAGEFLAKSEEVRSKLLQNRTALEWKNYGTARITDESLTHAGQLLVANFQRSAWDREKDVSPYAFQKKHLLRKAGCFGCPLQCMDVYHLPGIGGGVVSCMLYFGMPWATMLTDMDIWYESAILCQRQGIDVVSLSDMLAWAMELYQRGIITTKDTDGIPMEWGSGKAILEMSHKIVHREGFGDVLADGPVLAAQRIGRGSQEFAMHVKGLPLTNYPYNSSAGYALSAAVSPRGDTQKGSPLPELVAGWENLYAGEAATAAEKAQEAPTDPYKGRAATLIEAQDNVALADCLGICKWLTTEFAEGMPSGWWAELYSAGTGLSTSPEAMLEAIKRVIDLERAYDCREGLTREQDRIPKRFLNTVVSEGPRKGGLVEEDKLEGLKSEYYALRDWDVATGIPTRQTLERRGLRDVADDLERRHRLPKAPDEPA
ncbi:MAG TPA: aldehyde ferredoxin oxidoreductase family protein [Dehalococcoidia bacterium]|jgi:aldehyde:ferredoxin oxidoreductase|nr:aldehyde ferredoxin oxidoreductase family protein [Dehalococcoidia bacterium]